MRKIFVILLLIAATVAGAAYLGTDWLRPIPAFRVHVPGDAVYRLTWDALVGAGMPRKAPPVDAVRLTQMGTPVPVRVISDDDTFGRGDWIEFRGERLAGRSTYHHGFARDNVYQLAFEGTPSPPMHGPQGGAPTALDARSPVLHHRLHLEDDQLLIRLNRRDLPPEEEEPELWFWHKLTHVDAKPFVKDIDLADLDADAGGTIDLDIRFQALSHAPRRNRGSDDFSDHRVELTLNGEPLGDAVWDGKKPYTLELRDLDTTRFQVGPNRLGLRVPVRIAPNTTEPWVDVVMVDWIELDYPLQPRVGGDFRGQILVDLERDGPAEVIEVVSPAPSVTAYGDSGSLIEAVAVAGRAAGAGEDVRYRFRPQAGDVDYRLVAGVSYAVPSLIEVDAPSDLQASSNRADYLIIAHNTLMEAVEPLAALHRQRGLAVSMIDVQDIYDEWGGGIVHPKAIRDFIAYTRQEWAEPRPELVLLVGDASWDTKNNAADDSHYANWVNRELLAGRGRFVDNTEHGVQAYDQQLPPSQRSLIPTWSYASFEGHSASDNYFVAIEGDDMYPDLAIGRFPVIDPAEVTAIVDKTIHYLNDAEVGPWRRKILWITNEEAVFQRRTDRSAKKLQERGYEAIKVYPKASETDNAAHQNVLKNAFDEGQLLVHFFGHGGRHIWRTGPPDFKKNHDLFTLDHIDALAPNRRLPMILSLTCYSAPFDHPSADSIGEKFLRAPERGAVAVFAASWRNSPTIDFSEQLVAELTTPGMPIGEAIKRTKATLRSPTLVQTYNLLGDPAIQLTLPAWTVAVEPTTPGDLHEVVATVPEPEFSGQAIVDWLDADGRVLASREVAVENGTLRAALGRDADLDAVDGVSVYVWNQKRGVDGLGFAVHPRERTVEAEPKAVVDEAG